MILFNLLSFIIILSIIVFFHEFGHYIIARLNGVAIDEFAIGYGKEIFGFNDKNGTRWKVCSIPMGGFCKFFGDEDASSSIINSEKLTNFTKEEKNKCLFFKKPWQKILVAFAGPAFNYLLSLILFTLFFRINGIDIFTNKIGFIEDESPAQKADLRVGDIIKKINNKEIKNFSDIQEIVINSTNKDTLKIVLERNSQTINKDIIPNFVVKDGVKIAQIGVGSEIPVKKNTNLIESFYLSAHEILKITKNTAIAFFKMLIGKASFNNLSGPIKIAQYSGKAMKGGFMSVIYFTALISIGLGFMNLIPIPGLDGGHILIYFIEIVRKKPLKEETENLIIKIGFSILIVLTIFVMVKDITGIL